MVKLIFIINIVLILALRCNVEDYIKRVVQIRSIHIGDYIFWENHKLRKLLWQAKLSEIENSKLKSMIGCTSDIRFLAVKYILSREIINSKYLREVVINKHKIKLKVIIGKNNKGLAVGRYNSKLMNVFFLSDKFDLRDGQIVITSSDNQELPYGIYIGKIVHINNTAYINTGGSCHSKYNTRAN